MTVPGANGGAAGFIRANLDFRCPDGLPEIGLHTARADSGLHRISGGNAPYWAFPWPGGAALARFVLDHPETAAGRRVLDFGCGGGVAGIAAAKAGAAVFACDTDPLARIAAKLNAAANGVAMTVLDEVGALPTGSFDVVLAGDVFYSQPVARRAMPLLRNWRSGGAVVLVGDPGREYLPRPLLCEVARYRVADFGSTQAIGTVFRFEARDRRIPVRRAV